MSSELETLKIELESLRKKNETLVARLDVAFKHFSHDGNYCAVCDDYGPNNCPAIKALTETATTPESEEEN